MNSTPIDRGPVRLPAGRVVVNGSWPSSGGPRCSLIDCAESVRIVLMITPDARGTFRQQIEDVLSRLRNVLQSQRQTMVVTAQTVFLCAAQDELECRTIFAAHYGSEMPVTNFVFQPPCNGAALALEVWAVGGKHVRVERFGRDALTVSYGDVRWIHCVASASSKLGAYTQTLNALGQTRRLLDWAGSRFEHVVRTWFSLGDITGTEDKAQRYQQLNHARADFYHGLHFRKLRPSANHAGDAYPASTGIGMNGSGLAVSCLAVETKRKDVFLLPLENPGQIPAYDYQARYSRCSPKFSRAMALGVGDRVTTWISGTASILNSESQHLGNVEKQTEQTIDNIVNLIAKENFATHGKAGIGATLRDLAKIRVYLKRAEDLETCKAICERRFGPVPALYLVADICRPELLVEIEGVAFSKCSPTEKPRQTYRHFARHAARDQQ